MRILLLMALVLIQPGASAAQTLVEMNIGNFRISVPASWHLNNQTQDSLQIYVPLKNPPQTPVGAGEKEPAALILSEAGMLITIEPRRDHDEAVQRLVTIASEYNNNLKTLQIAGWPSMERLYRAPMPQPGAVETGAGNIETGGGNIETWFTTTAIAVEATVIRFETMFSPDADLTLLDEAFAIARSLRPPVDGPADRSQAELDEITRLAKPPPPAAQPMSPPGKSGRRSEERGPEPGIPVQVGASAGELEIATNDGQHVVIASNGGFWFSDDFGRTYTFGGATPCTLAVCDGDPSLAVGHSGAFYYSWIGGLSNNSRGDNISRSTDNKGNKFTLAGAAASCPGTTNCTLADQEHIAADRYHSAKGGGDRIYNVWRDFAPTFSIRISCSSDSGATWTAGVQIAGAGDFPCVTVGPGGFVYVVFRSGSNLSVNKYTPCDDGLAPVLGFPILNPITITKTVADIPCPVAGLDRCNNSNTLSSHTIAADDTDPSHIYVVFANNTSASNDDIIVFDSSDGGATWPRTATINNTATAARRFMPWICAMNGAAYISWYDRRAATTANNDLTDYFLGSVSLANSKLVVGPELNVSQNPDPQCASGWPVAAQSQTDATSCSVQPQLAGRCGTPPGLGAPGGSGIPCDFTTGPICPVNPGTLVRETCNTGRGQPKYGDYNGNACAANRVYTAWASATSPPGLAPVAGITLFSSVIDTAQLTVIAAVYPPGDPGLFNL